MTRRASLVLLCAAALFSCEGERTSPEVRFVSTALPARCLEALGSPAWTARRLTLTGLDASGRAEVGEDIDGRDDSSESSPCGIGDAPGGVDNSFGWLLDATLENLAGLLGPADVTIASWHQQVLADGRWTWGATFYAPPETDANVGACLLLDAEGGVPQQGIVVFPERGVYRADGVVARVPLLLAPTEPGRDVTEARFGLLLNEARVAFDAEAGALDVAGALPLAPLEADIRRLVVDAIPPLAGPSPESTAFARAADLWPDADDVCHAVSFGGRFTFVDVAASASSNE